MTEPYRLFIDGQWREGAQARRFDAVNPFNQTVWAQVCEASEDDVRDAVAAARRAYENTWRKTSGTQRAALLHRLADLLERDAPRMAQLESTDNGKTIRETHAQMLYVARIFRFFAGYADKIWGQVIPLDSRDVFDYAVREPYGVVGVITAWNSPIALLGNKLPAALAAGNCVVIKPSEHASVTTLEFCKLVEEAGFPAGVVNVVTGDVAIGRALVGGGGIDKITFTGSGHAGRDIASMAGKQLIPVTLELGGKSPNIVFADADVEKALVGALAGIFAAAGQTCIAGSRLLVQRPLYETMAQRLAERAERIVLGNPLDPATEMGTAANEPHFRRILAAIERGRQEGARLITGGGPSTDPALARGFFVQPTIFADVDNRMRLAQDEIFGPVLSMIPFDTEEEALSIANDSCFGLASAVWTQDISRAMRMTRELRAGVVWVNTYRMVSPQGPFGGVKESGYGRERGELGLQEFTITKNVMIDFSDEVRDPFAIKA